MIYELLHIVCGEATVVFATDSKKDAKCRYHAAMSSGELVRVRYNGEILPIYKANSLLKEKRREFSIR